MCRSEQQSGTDWQHRLPALYDCPSALVTAVCLFLEFRRTVTQQTWTQTETESSSSVTYRHTVQSDVMSMPNRVSFVHPLL